MQSADVTLEGESSLDGSLVVALVEQLGDSSLSPMEPFVLAADSLTVKTFYFDPQVNVAGGTALQPQADETVYRTAIMESTEVRGSFKWALYPHGKGAGAAWIAPCVSLSPSLAPQVERSSNVAKPDEPDNVVRADVADALRAQPCTGGGTIRVIGDFLLTLWEWDAMVESNGERNLLQSGRERSSFDPIGSPATRGVVSHARHQYLYVTGGDLEFPAWAGLNVYVHSEAAVNSDGTQAFRDASGFLGVGGFRQELAADTLTTQGSLAFTFGAPSVGQPLHFVATGTVRSADADGQPVELAAVASGSNATQLGYWAGAAALALLAGTAVSFRSSRPWRARRCLDWAMKFTDAQEYPAALRWTARAGKLRGDDARIHALRALVLSRLDRHEEALKAHGEANRLLADSGDVDLLAFNAVSAAAVALAADKIPTVLDWLRLAMKADGARFYASLVRPEFARLRMYAMQLHRSDAYP